MLLYYHGYYNILYACILIPTSFYQLLVFKIDVMTVVKFILTMFYAITEIFRYNFGFTGNISESFPELIAFLIQTFLFSIAFVAIPFAAKFKLPHEDCMYFINLVFLVLELIIGFFVYVKFSNTQSAAFYRRTAPLIDKKFRKKYDNISGEAVGAGHMRSV